jgi:hypothetical protein
MLSTTHLNCAVQHLNCAVLIPRSEPNDCCDCLSECLAMFVYILLVPFVIQVKISTKVDY